MVDPETALDALDDIDAEHLSEHFHEVRTAGGRVHNRRKYTAVCRVDGDGDLQDPVVLDHQQGSHYRDETGRAVLVFALTGQPFMEREAYERRLREEKWQAEQHYRGKLQLREEGI